MAAWLKALWLPMKAALIKKRAEYRYYAADYLMGVLIKFIFFVAMLLISPTAEPKDLLSRVLGFVLWYFAAHILAKLSNTMVEEAYLGTASQIFVARTSLPVFLATLAMAEILLSTVWIATFLVLAAPFTPILSAISQFSPSELGMVLLVFAVTIFGLVGMGLCLFGLSIKFKQVGSFSEVLIYFMLFFSGFFVPVNNFPRFVLALGYLSPLFWAMKIIGDIFHGQIRWKWFVAAMAIGSLWIFLGVVITGTFLQQAKRKGTLTNY